MKNVTMKDIAKRAKEIMDEYTVEEVLKMDMYQAHADANEQARKELAIKE